MNFCTEDTIDGNSNKPKFRQCTDILWLWLYTLLGISMVLIAVSAYVYGNPRRLINGYDSFGNVCAFDKNEKLGDFNLSGANTVDKPYLFSMDLSDVHHSVQICVKKCPDVDLHSMKDIENFYLRTGSLLCRYDMDFNATHDPSSLLNTQIGPCPKLPVYKSVSVFNRCVPDELKGDGIFNLNQSWDLISNFFGNLYASWLRITLLTVFSFLLAAVILLLLFTVPKQAAWTILFLVCIVSLALTSTFWWTYFEIKCKLDSDLPEHLLIEEIFNEEISKWCAIVSSFVTLFIMLLAFSLRKQVLFVVSLIQESSNCLSELSLLFLVPVGSFFLLFVFYSYWISVVVCLSTGGYPESKDWKPFAILSNSTAHYVVDGLDFIPLNITVDELKSFTAVNYKEVIWFKFMLIIYVVGSILISQFVIACQHMIVAGSVTTWYFCQVNKNPTTIVTGAVGNLICYHIGSVAFGSLLMTFFRIPRILLQYLRKISGRTNYSNPYGIKCACDYYCCDKLIQNVNHDAYAVIAMQGVNYCTAAHRAWRLVANSALRLSAINSAGNTIFFLGKYLVTSLTICIAILLFKYDANLRLSASSTLTVGFFAYFVAHSVLSLYELVNDTLFLCICEDQEINGHECVWKTTLLAKIEHSGLKARSNPPPTEL